MRQSSMIGAACKLLALTLLVRFADSARDIVLFGDSLSDNGQGYAGTVKLVLQTDAEYPQIPYYEGRWQNGPTWIEHAAKMLGSLLLDYGAGGASSGSQPAQVPALPIGFSNLTYPVTVLSPNLFQQVDAHLLNENGTLSSKPVYIVFIGGNDYFTIAFENTSASFVDVTQNIVKNMDTLYARGARDFILPLVPELAALPVFNHPDLYGNFSADAVARLDNQIDQQNGFQKQLVSLFQSTHPNATVTIYDWPAALGAVIANASSYGITNLADACYVITPAKNTLPHPLAQPIGRAGGSLCSSPNSHLFFDQFHASAIVHQHIGADFAAKLGQSIFGVNPASQKASSPLPASSTQKQPLPVLKSPPPAARARAPLATSG